MKKIRAITLLTVILFSGALAFSSCKLKENKEAQNTPIFHVPSQDDLPGAKKAIDYNVSFEPLIEFYGEAFPVKIISTASMNTLSDGSPRMVIEDDYIGDSYGDFGVTLSIKRSSGGASEVKVPFRIEIEGDRFIKKSSLDVMIPQDKKIEIFPRIVYDYDALGHLIQPATANVFFRLFYDSVQLTEKMEVVRFHSVNEVPLYVIDRRDEENIIDCTYYIAAYVNENDPLIDKILQEALQIAIVEKIGFGGFSFSGYDIKDEDGDSSLSVNLQVLAVWSVFLKNNIKYSNITTTSTESNKFKSQYVRTLGESFGNTQANCVDGSVLFASVLRKIGIETALVILPGHMLVAYLTTEDEDENGKFSVAYLETTKLGSVDISKYTKDESFWGKIKNFIGMDTRSSVTRDSFLSALEAGWETINEADPDDFKVIDIKECRARGIQPIVRQY